MQPAEVPGYGEVISFTTLYSPPTGFASPLHMALVQLEGGVKFFCHGSETRGLRVGSRVAIEAVDHIYYFSMLGLAERARMFWRRGGIRAGHRVAAFVRSAAKRLTRGSGGPTP
ncbi:MAG: OB-fold domain-containing protein [Candidatus Rokubacteria bacterium]|nr:OB-fold domain-containing protein [Candidatus Rokubacteria bacterium]